TTVLSLLESRGGPVLLPLQDATADELLDRLPALAKELSDAAGSDVTVGAAVARTRADVPGSWAQASDVLRLAVQLGRPAGSYQLRDVLLEYQLTRPSDAVTELAAVLAPLDRHPDLLQTLQVYVGNDLDRRGTAALLHVHPNTLDYRVRRIVDLTGIDPATSHGLQLLGAALTARGLITEPS
ncbi:MAG TPA: helix-turn-helix domain-containing protein, partial [Mycobacteriales bacterium]|nr:helix-turn-helix domain-containing protein [Mycobacteriales bacterium]